MMPGPGKWFGLVEGNLRQLCLLLKEENAVSPEAYDRMPLIFFLIFEGFLLFFSPWTILSDEYWQLLPSLPLFFHPASSLLLLHSQPPLLNVLYFGVLFSHFQLGIPGTLVATLLFMGISLGSLYVYYHLGVLVFSSRRLALLPVVFLLLHPSFAHFQRVFFYPHLLFFQTGLLVLLVGRWACNPSIRRFLAVAACYGLMAYTRSLWHPLLGAILIFVLPLLMTTLRQNKPLLLRHIVAGLVLLGGLVAPWLLKNQVLYNTPSFSSWLGYNLGGKRTREFINEKQLPQDAMELARAYYSLWQLDILSRHSATNLLHKDFPADKNTVRKNLNHYCFVPLSQLDTHERLWEFRTNPAMLLDRIFTHLACLDMPPHLHPYDLDSATGRYWSMDNYTTYAFIHDQIIYGNRLKDYLVFRWNQILVRPGLFLLLFLPLMLAYSCHQTFFNPVEWRRPLFGTVFFLYLWFLGMVLFVDGRESARMRWELEGLYFLVILFFGHEIFSQLRRKKNSH